MVLGGLFIFKHRLRYMSVGWFIYHGLVCGAAALDFSQIFAAVWSK